MPRTPFHPGPLPRRAGLPVERCCRSVLWPMTMCGVVTAGTAQSKDQPVASSAAPSATGVCVGGMSFGILPRLAATSGAAASLPAAAIVLAVGGQPDPLRLGIKPQVCVDPGSLSPPRGVPFPARRPHAASAGVKGSARSRRFTTSLARLALLVGPVTWACRAWRTCQCSFCQAVDVRGGAQCMGTDHAPGSSKERVAFPVSGARRQPGGCRS